jgi:hypothetical protein
MGVTGDFAKLRGTEATLRKIGSSTQLAALNANLLEEGLNLVSEGFSAGTDPYGQPWDAPNNLQITGRIRSYAGRSSAAGFTIFATDQKAVWHHAPRPRARWGGKSLPTRLQVPTPERGLPAKWEKRFETVAAEFMRRHFR